MVFLHDAIELLQGKQGKHFKVPPDIRVRGSQEKLQELQLRQRSEVIRKHPDLPGRTRTRSYPPR